MVTVDVERSTIMKKRNAKRIMASILVFAVLVGGSIMMQKKTSAADSYVDQIIYEEKTAEFKKMWKTDGTGTTPKKAGYVFGGWYEATQETDAEGNTIYKALSDTEDSAQAKVTDDELQTGIFAKFVPSYVLSVKAQLDAGTKKADDGKQAYIRLLSSVDSADYLAVGFDVWLNHSVDATIYNDNQPLESTTVYDGLKVATTDDDDNVTAENTYSANKIFGNCSKYLNVWRLEEIYDVNDAVRIYVRPYWYTCDGTRVEGLAKYIHVEDGYSDYISVPVNLYQQENVAGGYLNMAYNSEYFQVHDVEYAKLFDNVECNYSDSVGTVKIVGNSSADKEADDLFANVRFTLTEAGKAAYSGVGSGTFFDFAIEGENFSNWDEELVGIDAWDAKY
jgi:hypothetical protein